MNSTSHELNAAPKTELAQNTAAARIAEALDLLVEEMHPLGSVVEAFRPLLVERARFKAELQDYPCIPVKAPAPERFERGIPLLTMEAIIDGIGDALWVRSAERLMPVMQRSFPKIGEDLEVIEHALRQGRLDPKTPLKASLASEKSLKKALISGIEVSSLTLAFALGQVAKPLIEKISENMRALVEGLSWSKGYCPICGTMPELAFLQGEGGQRWLRCASCSHEWRFTRLVCPFCECNDQQELEVYFVADREYESIDVCHRCGRYVPTVDQRSWSKPIAREVAAMALMHLDVISQEKGFLPAALCAWNIIRSGDIFSTSVRV